ncbi:MAG: PqqD family protein [Pyrinomonadaceae bacterium]|nr:PqqD family protein [Pyrinomonadaceae bacterium]
MKREPREFLPLARRERMIIKEVDNELLVYDLQRDQAHCLNPSAAAIWRLCDGKTTPDRLAMSFEKETGNRVDEGVIWLGLQDLRRSHLLEEGVDWPEQMIVAKRMGMSRREAVRRIGLGAAIALPLVISITAPTAVQAAVSCGARCKPCSTGSECCSGVCVTDPAGCNPGTRRCA